jgi:hypothetical protein
MNWLSNNWIWLLGFGFLAMVFRDGEDVAAWLAAAIIGTRNWTLDKAIGPVTLHRRATGGTITAAETAGGLGTSGRDA